MSNAELVKRLQYIRDHRLVINMLSAGSLMTLNEAIAALQAQDDVRNRALKEAALIADKWATEEQRRHGNGGAGAEIRALTPKPAVPATECKHIWEANGLGGIECTKCKDVIPLRERPAREAPQSWVSWVYQNIPSGTPLYRADLEQFAAELDRRNGSKS